MIRAPRLLENPYFKKRNKMTMNIIRDIDPKDAYAANTGAGPWGDGAFSSYFRINQVKLLGQYMPGT